MCEYMQGYIMVYHHSLSWLIMFVVRVVRQPRLFRNLLLFSYRSYVFHMIATWKYVTHRVHRNRGRLFSDSNSTTLTQVHNMHAMSVFHSHTQENVVRPGMDMDMLFNPAGIQKRQKKKGGGKITEYVEFHERESSMILLDRRI